MHTRPMTHRSPFRNLSLAGTISVAAALAATGCDPRDGNNFFGQIEVDTIGPMQRHDAAPVVLENHDTGAPLDASIADAGTRAVDAAAPDSMTLLPDGAIATPEMGNRGAFRFVGYGDSRTNPNTHRMIVGKVNGLNPELVLFSGDMQASYSTGSLTGWLNDVRGGGSVLAELLLNRRILIARGNHDSGVVGDARWKDLTRQTGNSEKYAFTYKNAFFVTTGYMPDAAFLDMALKTPEAMAARWRVVWTHAPVYSSGANHGINGMKAVEDVCDRNGVDVFLSGHEHIYERSHQMKGGQVVDRTDALTGGMGTVYMVSGGGGAPLYGVRKPLPSSHFAKSVNHYCQFDVTDSTLTMVAHDISGATLDQFTIRK